MRVHLIDGTFELFRGFYGAPSRQGPGGQEVGATRSLVRSTLRLLDKEATHVAIAFDTVIESFRNELYDGYKTGEGIEPALHSQFELAERATRALGVVTWSMIDFEADDALAAAAARFADDPAVEQIVLCSPDKDLAQSVRGQKVVMWDRIRDTVRGEPEVIEKFGVRPESIPDYLALVGDSADGFPGLPGWGAKSSATLLAEYGRLEDIPDDPSTWSVKVRSAAKLGATLASSRDEAMLYKTLATLRVDVPLEESLADLEWRGADREAITALADELGDDRLVGLIKRFA